MKLYINGVYQEEFSMTGTIADTTTTLRFGRRGGTSYFDGRLDEIAIWNTVLSEGTLLVHAQEGLYETSGTYESGIFDAGSSIAWNELSWNEAIGGYSKRRVARTRFGAAWLSPHARVEPRAQWRAAQAHSNLRYAAVAPQRRRREVRTAD